MENSTDTIAAISTAMNNSGIGIIRISGEDAFSIIRKIFRPANPDKDMTEVKSHTVHYGNIVDDGRIVDEVLVLIMKAPHTYTRENTVEIDCHGGMFVMNQVMDLVLKAGARTAEPGEFTKRAFLNGRIDLTQAEAVIDVINAENSYALKSAVSQLKGSVSEKIKELRADLLEQIAYIEAALDDPEHIEMDNYGAVLLPVVLRCESRIRSLIKTSEDGRIIKEGIRTVILGKPNAGKSSLLNVLLGTERAIVTQIPGTTRDALEESVRLDDVVLNMIDTAGIRDTDDLIEKLGVDKAKDYARDADLILWVMDGSEKIDQEDKEILKLAAGKKTILLLNKQDLPGVTGKDRIREFLEESFPADGGFSEGNGPAGTGFSESNGPAGTGFSESTGDFLPPIIEISALKETGIDQLIRKIREMFYKQEVRFNDQVYITNLRQKEALIKAGQSLEKAKDSIEAGMPEDFYTIDLMDAYSSLGTVIGETVEDDLADEIFAKFCMGK